MVLAGRDVKTETLEARRELLERRVLPHARRAGALHRRTRCEPARSDPLREGAGAGGAGREAPRQPLRAGPALRRVDEDARSTGARSSSSAATRSAAETFDALIFGYYDEGERLIYAARTRNGFTPAMRAQLFKEIPPARDPRMPVRQSAGSEERPMGTGIDEGEDGRLPLARSRCWSGSSSSSNGPARITCGTAGSSACARTSRRATSGASDGTCRASLAHSEVSDGTHRILIV